ncbi:hypothetical protein HY745_06890 [Candidatus Desantisbacteria bacterium]|nr:hypothetical protein [Candidatus Desantisbacteria bacterium]
MKAEIVYWHKAKLQNRYVLELKIWNVGKSDNYPDGHKFSLICFDIKTKKKILIDNHKPKRSHIHIDDKEIPYDYVDEDKLIEDFKKIILEHLGVKL